MLLLAMALSLADGACIEAGSPSAIALAERILSQAELDQAVTDPVTEELDAAMACLTSPLDYQEAVKLHRAHGNTLIWRSAAKADGFHPILGPEFERKGLFFSVDGVPTSHVPSTRPFVLQVFSDRDDVYQNRHQLLHSGYHQPEDDLSFIHALRAGDESEWMDRAATGVGALVFGGLLTGLGVVEVLSASQTGLVDAEASIGKGSVVGAVGSGMMIWGSWLCFDGVNEKDLLPPLMR